MHLLKCVGLGLAVTAGLVAASTVIADMQTAKEPITVYVDDNGNYRAETDTLGVDVTNKPAGVAAIYNAANGAGEGMAIDETQHGFGLAGGTGGLKAGTTPATQQSYAADEGYKSVSQNPQSYAADEKYKAPTKQSYAADEKYDSAAAKKAAETKAKNEKSQKLCKMDSDAASKLAANDAQLNANGGADASAVCKKLVKDALKACASGDEAAFKKAKDEGKKQCMEPEKTGAAVNTPTPVSNPIAAVQNAVGNAVQQMGSQQGIQNIAGQMLASKLSGMMSGGSGGDSSDSSSSGSSSSPLSSAYVKSLIDEMNGQNTKDNTSIGGSEVQQEIALDNTLKSCQDAGLSSTETTTEVVNGVKVVTTKVVDTCSDVLNGNWSKLTTYKTVYNADGTISQFKTDKKVSSEKTNMATASVPCSTWPEAAGLVMCTVKIPTEQAAACGTVDYSITGNDYLTVTKDCPALHDPATIKTGLDADFMGASEPLVIGTTAPIDYKQATEPVVQIQVPCKAGTASGTVCQRWVPEAAADKCGYHVMNDGRKVFLGCPELRLYTDNGSDVEIPF